MSCSFFFFFVFLVFFYYCRGFATQTNALAPQLPSHHSRGVTSIQNITTKSLKFSGVETEVELILARMHCFQKAMTICPAYREG